jgi:hypothetical protein
MEDVLDKEEMIRVYAVDRAGFILKDGFRLASDDKDSELEDRVMKFSERIESFIKGDRLDTEETES